MMLVPLLVWMMASGVATQASPSLPADAMARTTWMLGCWQTDNKLPEAMRVEWRRVSPTLTMGIVSTGPQGLFGSFEYVRIELADGLLNYVSSRPVEGAVRLQFETSSQLGAVAFKGADGRGVAWRRVKDNEALVSLTIDGRKLDVPLKRKDCD